MLQFMRKRASSWMIKAILSIIVLAFVFMGVGNFGNRKNRVAAEVNGEAISAAQFQERYYELKERFRQQFGDQLDNELLERLNLKEQAMEQLITEELLVQKAVDYGLRVTDAELSRYIQNIVAFQQNGRFDPGRYNQVLRRSRLTPESFEQRQRRQLLVNKFRSLITGSVKVAEDEAWRWYKWQNKEVNIHAAVFDPQNFQEVQPSHEAVAAYFNNHKDKYRTPEKKKIAYILFEPENYTSRVDIDEYEIKQYYQDNKTHYETEKTVAARHILIKAGREAPQSLVEKKRKKALEIYEMLKDGQKDFAAIAKKYSEGPSASEGGRLGEFKKEEMVAPFAEKAFAMQAGEISQPVRTRYGWHLIKVEKINEASIKPLSEVRDEIKEKLTLTKARDLAYEKALEAFDEAIDADSVNQAAQSLDLPLETTSFFPKENRITDVPDGKKLARQAFDLMKGQISDVIELGDGYCLFQVTDRKKSEIPALEAVKKRVVADVKTKLQKESAKKKAEDFLSGLKQKELSPAWDNETSGESRKSELVTTGFFNRREGVPEIGHVPAIMEAAFNLSPDNPVHDSVVAADNKFYVISLAARKFPDKTDFDKEKQKTIKSLQQKKENQVFSQWLGAMKSRNEITRENRFLE